MLPAQRHVRDCSVVTGPVESEYRSTGVTYVVKSDRLIGTSDTQLCGFAKFYTCGIVHHPETDNHTRTSKRCMIKMYNKLADCQYVTVLFYEIFRKY